MLVAEGERAREVSAGHVLLAPGAHDRPVAFPGWTLPGVLTAGAAQTIVKAHRVAPGERLLFAGSGPLALAFPAQLHHYGVNVVARARGRARTRAGGRPAAGRGCAGQRAAPSRRRRATARSFCGGVFRCATGGSSCAPREGSGSNASSMPPSIATGACWPAPRSAVEVDTLCLGYGFFPSVELLRVAGCELRYDEDLGGPVAVVDRWQRTTVPGISAAGDGTGVRGSYVAEDEGRLAALGLVEDETRAAPIRRRLERKRRFQRALTRMYRVGPGIYELTTPDTVVCRCEEVARGRARPCDRRDAGHQRRQGLHARHDGPLPGAQLPAADRRA